MNRGLLVLGVTGIAAGVVWHMTTQLPVAHAVTGMDQSLSVEMNCGDLRNANRAFLRGKRGIGAGSTLTVLVMGTDASNPHPKRVFNGVIPIPPDTVYGRDDEAFRLAEDAFFGEVENACQTAVAGSRSPIYELVRQGLAHLHSASVGCVADGRCYFLLKTDLDEDVQPELRAALDQAAKDDSIGAPPKITGSLDNTGIEVTVCGIAEVKPRRGPAASVEVRMRIWRQLFTHPELVSFQPYCSE